MSSTAPTLTSGLWIGYFPHNYIPGISFQGEGITDAEYNRDNREHFHNIAGLLESEGADWRDIVRTTCYLADFRHYDVIVLMKAGSSPEDVDHVIGLLDNMGLGGRLIEGADPKMVEVPSPTLRSESKDGAPTANPKTVEVLGINGQFDRARLEKAAMETGAVERVLEQVHPSLAAGRKPGERTIEVPLGAGATVGGRKLGIIAGPCAVENRSQVLEIAAAVKEAGATALRGGAFKPRTSPYSFQGLGEDGLELLALAREQTGLPIVTEVMRCDQVELVARYADVLQVGSRNMHNSHLLAAVGRQSKPILLKRGWSATLEEFLLAAEYIMAEGNRHVILCERGIRTHETYVRNTLALAIVPEIKRISNLPIIVDPSHGTGRRHLVTPMSNAAIACGADGLIIEVHPTPDQAWTDGPQSLSPAQFHSLMKGLKPLADACHRDL